MWHILADGSTPTDRKVLCGAGENTERTTSAAAIGRAGLKMPIICPTCAGLVTDEHLRDEERSMPSMAAKMPRKHKITAAMIKRMRDDT